MQPRSLEVCNPWRMFLSRPVGLSAVSRQEHGTANSGLDRGANYPHVFRLVLRLRSVSPFIPTRRDYSGSAVILKEEATKAAFSSPPRGRSLSPVAYRSDLPTVGRRRTSPVCLGTIFLRRQHVPPPWATAGNRISCGGKDRPGGPPVLHSRAVTGTPRRPMCLLPKSACLAPS